MERLTDNGLGFRALSAGGTLGQMRVDDRALGCGGFPIHIGGDERVDLTATGHQIGRAHV